MSSAHHEALKKVLAGIEKQISADEERLMRSDTDQDRERIVQEIADLKVRQREIRDTLTNASI